jgi:hypothetical protein
VTSYVIVTVTEDEIATRTEIGTGASEVEITRTRSEITDERTVTAILAEKLILATTTDDTGDRTERIGEVTVIGEGLNIVVHTRDSRRLPDTSVSVCT